MHNAAINDQSALSNESELPVLEEEKKHIFWGESTLVKLQIVKVKKFYYLYLRIQTQKSISQISG